MVPTGDLPWVEPIQPVLHKPFVDKKWSFELKYDGFRGLLYIPQRGAPRFISRQAKILRRFDKLALSVKDELPLTEAILDGEIIAKDEQDKPQFNDLMRHRRAASYVAFDLLWQDGEDLRELPLRERRKRLALVLPKKSRVIDPSYFNKKHQSDGEWMFENVCQFDFEGVVAKRLDDPYGKRTKWYKWINPKYTQLEGREEMFKEILRANKQKAAR